MEYVTYIVYPETHATWMNMIAPGLLGQLDFKIGAMKVRPLRFTLASWDLYTPFEVKLYKNNVLKETRTINTIGGTSTIVLEGDTADETVKIQNLGKIGTGLGEPGFGDLLVFGGGSHIFKVEGNIINEIKYDQDAYSFSRVLCSLSLFSTAYRVNLVEDFSRLHVCYFFPENLVKPLD